MKILAVGLLVVATIGGVAGCGASASVVAVSESISARVSACRCTEAPREVVAIARGGRVILQHASGLSRAERACVIDSLGAIETPSTFGGFRFRVRWRSTPSVPVPPNARDFIRSREPEISACLPGRTTRVVATPEGDRYALSVELVDDEPELDTRERACILSALEGVPAPPGTSHTEVIVMFGPGAPCAAPDGDATAR